MAGGWYMAALEPTALQSQLHNELLPRSTSTINWVLLCDAAARRGTAALFAKCAARFG